MAKIMTREALAHVKLNIRSYVDHYVNGDDPEEWIPRELGDRAFEEIDDNLIGIKLVELNAGKNVKEADNIKTLYLNMIGLNDSFAGDERLWAGLAHTFYYRYMLERWPDTDPDKILDHFFFNNDMQRSYLRNGLARLWWFGRMLYDANDTENPFKMLDYTGNDLMGTAFRIFTNNWANSKRSRKLFFQGLYRFTESTGIVANRTIMGAAVIEMNGLWGSYIVDLCDDEFIIDAIYQAANRAYTDTCNKPTSDIKNETEEDTVNLSIIDFLKNHDGLCSEAAFTANLSNDLKLSEERINHLMNELHDSNNISKLPFRSVIHKNEHMVMLSNDYLTESCNEFLKLFFQEQIDDLTSENRIAFNILCAQPYEYSIDDIVKFMETLNPQIFNINDPADFVQKNHKALEQMGFTEPVIQPDGTLKYRKAYTMIAGD